MGFKKYPQPPFKKYVKTSNGTILLVGEKRYYPAVYNKRGTPLVRFGWEICWGGQVADKEGNIIAFVDFCDVIVATADTKEELENESQQ